MILVVRFTQGFNVIIGQNAFNFLLRLPCRQNVPFSSRSSETFRLIYFMRIRLLVEIENLSLIYRNHMHLAPKGCMQCVGYEPSENLIKCFSMRKLWALLGYTHRRIRDDRFSYFITIPACVWQTDRRTELALSRLGCAQLCSLCNADSGWKCL